MSTQRAVGIIGATIWGNRGAEAMLVTTIGQVRERYSGTEVHVFSYAPGKDRRLVPDPSIHFHSSTPKALVLIHFPFSFLYWLLGLIGVQFPEKYLLASMKALRDCNVLLDISGVSYVDGREKFIPFNILTNLPAMFFDVPVVKLAQAVGSFNNLPTKLAAKAFLTRCYHVFARGKITAEHLQLLPVSEDKWTLTNDIAFLYKIEYSLSDENEQKVTALESQLKNIRESDCEIIGLIPSSLVYQKSVKAGRDYVGRFLRIIRQMDSHHHFVLMPNATREGSDSVRNNDLYVIYKIFQRASQGMPREMLERIHVVDYDVNTAGTRRLITLCDVLLTSRFHGMVSGLSLGVPTVVVGWSHKYAEVMAEFGMEDYVVDFNDPELDMPQLIQEVLARKGEIHTQLTTALTEVQALSARQFEFLDALMD